MQSNTLLDKRIFERGPGPFVPGVSGNPAGRPPNYGSITYWLKVLLAENEGKKAREIADKALEIAQSGSLPHLNLVLDRVDGAIASEVNVKGVFLHVGDEYASLGLAAIKEDVSRKHQESLEMPQTSTEMPLLPQMGTLDSPRENDPVKSDES